jgi:hypothetical protein
MAPARGPVRVWAPTGGPPAREGAGVAGWRFRTLAAPQRPWRAGGTASGALDAAPGAPAGRGPRRARPCSPAAPHCPTRAKGNPPPSPPPLACLPGQCVSAGERCQGRALRPRHLRLPPPLPLPRCPRPQNPSERTPPAPFPSWLLVIYRIQSTLCWG